MAKYILSIESSTDFCSVAVSDETTVVAHKEISQPRSHASMLAPIIDEVIKEAGITIKELSAVAVSEGPGSYTGLRVGLSTAKGICFGAKIPLIAINTLAILAQQGKCEQCDLIVPMIDARRMEVYAALYDRALNVKREIAADIVDENSYLEFLEKHPVYFFGNGSAKCREKITHPNAHFIENIYPLAKWMFPLAEKAKAKEDFKDVAYFEPFYLKEFVASKPKKLI